MKKTDYKKNGFISIVYVVMILGAIIILMSIFTIYQHQLIIRNFEAAADLAAVESLRQQIDEAALRNEVLQVKEENLNKIRKGFLEKIRNHLPSNTYEIIRIEIPTISDTGVIEFPEMDVKDMDFPNSETTPFTGPNTVVDAATGIARSSYFVDGNSSDNCAIEVAKVSGNLATSGTKKKDAYMFTSKVTIFFKTTSNLNRMSISMLNYVNILSGNEKQIVTKQIDRNTVAVTLQAIGEVVLR